MPSHTESLSAQPFDEPMMQQTDPPKKRFCLEEATIDELHRAIKAGEITCLEVVQRYIERVRAYNGV